MASVTHQTIKSYKVTKLGLLKKIEIDNDPSKSIVVNTLEIHPSKNKGNYEITMTLFQSMSKLSATIFDPNLTITKKEVKMDNVVPKA